MSRFIQEMNDRSNKVAMEKAKQKPEKLSEEELAMRKLKQEQKFIKDKRTMLK